MKTLIIILSGWRGINTSVIVGLASLSAANAYQSFMDPLTAVYVATAIVVTKSLESTIDGWLVDLRKSPAKVEVAQPANTETSK